MVDEFDDLRARILEDGAYYRLWALTGFRRYEAEVDQLWVPPELTRSQARLFRNHTARLAQRIGEFDTRCVPTEKAQFIEWRSALLRQAELAMRGLWDLSHLNKQRGYEALFGCSEQVGRVIINELIDQLEAGEVVLFNHYLDNLLRYPTIVSVSPSAIAGLQRSLHAALYRIFGVQPPAADVVAR